MTFLVYEKDPFVCADICESLCAAFPRCKVSPVPSLDAFESGVSDGCAQTTIIMAITVDDMVKAQSVVSSLSGSADLVIIGSEKPSDSSVLARAAFVQKPFSSQGLISAIRDGFSDRLACP